MKCLICSMAVAMTMTTHGQGTIGNRISTFVFPAVPQAAEWFNGFTQSFFTNRIDIGPTIFPREYLTIADAWLYDAFRDGQPIRQFHRQRLLKDMLDDEGYVLSQQHGATSHDHGWPFPHWIQVPLEDGFRGVTAGWHFYDNKLGWEICYDAARNAAPEHFGSAAAGSWQAEGLEDRGINQVRNGWELSGRGGSATLTSPRGMSLDPFNCPFIQIRWHTAGDTGHLQPYMEWKCKGDAGWSRHQRITFSPDWLEGAGRSESTGMFHSIIPLYDHPKWRGRIIAIRFVFPDLEKDRTVFVRSVFTHWDTRHLVNNAIYIKAAYDYFRWTGDRPFLDAVMPRLRTAMRFMMEKGHGLELNHIRCTWHGHDGRPGFTVNSDGTKTFHVGHGKGGNYWDLLPFGWDDMYTTTHYYAALLVMAQLESIMPGGLDPGMLRQHAEAVKTTVNRKFWDERTGRFVGCIDADGISRDYGFTFVNLEAIHYGLASEEHAKKIMEWINGERIVEEDTSTGSDIYAYRLAPRATTRRNVEWYSFAWTSPESLPFGGQVQDGGAVLGFSFYDIMSRIKTLGADNAWERLMAIRAWDEEVARYGGYRKYYGDGMGGTTLQGGGTAGGIGIDFEFTESSMLSAVIPLGFMGLRPDGEVLIIEPVLPKACPQMKVRNLFYRGIAVDIQVARDEVSLRVHEKPEAPLEVSFRGKKLTVNERGEYQIEAGSHSHE